MKHLEKHILHISMGIVLIVIVQCVSGAEQQNLVRNGDFSQTYIIDNTWDGVNRQNELVVHTESARILISGSDAQSKRFGASPCWSDVTGDNKPDLLVADANGFVWIFQTKSKLNVYPPVFTTGRFVHAYFGIHMNIDAKDINADRVNDIIIGYGNGDIRLLRNNGAGRFLPTAAGEPLTTPLFTRGEKARYLGRYLAPRLVDWNKDGKFDLILGEGSYSANSVYLYLNQANNSNPDFHTAQRHWLAYGMGREHLSPAYGDLDGDGDLDLLVAERTGAFTWYENVPRDPDGDTPFLLEPKDAPVRFGDQEYPADEFPRPYLADLDADGDLDLIIGRNDGRIMLSRNIGSAREPQFATAVFLKGIDTLKPYSTVSHWNFGGGHTTAITMEAREEKDDFSGETIQYAHIFFTDGYVGTSGGIGSGCSIEYDKTYRLSFRARGYSIRAGCSIGQSAERYVEGEFVRHAGGESVGFDVNVSTDWQTFSKTFRFSRLTKESKDRTSTGVHFGVGLSGARGDSWFDIAHATIMPAEASQ